MKIQKYSNFKNCLLSLYEGSKTAPALYIKERKLSDAKKMQNIALAHNAREYAAHAGKVVCLIEHDIQESTPPTPPEKTGRGHKVVVRDNGIKPQTIRDMRRAYKDKTAEEVAEKADEVIKKGEIPTRSMFLGTNPRLAGFGGTDEWYTPPYIVEAARKAMGGIDCDPASCKEAQKWIKAKKYYHKDNNGLANPWEGRVFLNPPFVIKEINSWINRVCTDQNVLQACVVVNNNTETEWGQQLLERADYICFHKGRVKFVNQKGEVHRSGVQGSMIAGIGVNSKFIEFFSPMGRILQHEPEWGGE